MTIKKGLRLRLIAFCTTCILVPAIACPATCICKWRNGKRYVECSDRNLKSIPNPLDSETQVLDVSGNDLQVLHKEMFQKLGLLDLQKVYLQNCRLQKIDNHAFKGLANLVELDLSNNYLTAIPSTNFIYFPSLMRLTMNSNKITGIKTHCFQPLSYLNTLELSDCQIETIEQEAFSGLSHLEWLRLNGNRLSNIQGEKLFPDTLRGIELHNNYWNCDCHLRDLHSWLMNFNMPHTVEPICSLPERLKQRTITSVAEEDLACLPKIIPSTKLLEVNAGANVTFECLVKAIPEAKILWLFQGHLIPNMSTMSHPRHIYYAENGVTDKKSELYIYNIRNDNNGTYSCVVENTAGRAVTNYTLSVIAKEEPAVTVVTFHQRHLVVIVTVVFLIIILLIAIIAVVLLKFKTDTKSRKKKESGKDVALCNQLLPPSRSNIGLPKNNGSVIVNAHLHHDLHYTIQTNRDYEANELYQSNMKVYGDRNPDLISEAETVANSSQIENTVLSVYNAPNLNGDGYEEETAFVTPAVQRQVTWQDQQNMNPVTVSQTTMNNMYQHSVDVHLNPGCFLDSDGYPYDYGLPKHGCRQPIASNYSMIGPFYQTLPHNRAKAQKLVCNFAKDNEFNASPVPSACKNYEMLNATNVRRTLEGYPVKRNRQIAFVGNGTVYYNDEFVPSPPEGYKTEPTSSQCCAPAETCAPWVNPKGTCAVMVPLGVADAGRCYQVETRCVDTQTTEARIADEAVENVLKPLPQLSNAKCVSDMCSESPDEGYVGDANDI